jgi:methanogenic corrinoid protein MtbC1
MDEKAANQDFFAAMSNLTLDEVCVEIIPAVLIQIGNDWHDGLITIAAEHYATSFLMGKLFSIFNNLQILVPNDISVLVACAQGERHEVGALLLAIFLRKKGYAVRYFGADLPIYDLLEVCRKLKPRILVISAMMKQSITALNDLPERLREYSSETHLVVGGSALSEDNNATHVANGIAKYYGGRTIQAGIATIESLVGYPK